VESSVVAIGTFDGVHLGHQALLREAVRLATGSGAGEAFAAPLPVVVVTFWPHPLRVLAPRKAPPLLCDLHDRLALLRAAGAEQVRVVPFTRELAQWEPATFVEAILDPLRPRLVVVGENFRFGREAAGTPELLAALGGGRFTTHPIGLVTRQGHTVSSSAIREALGRGDVERAGDWLGRPFRVRGVVQVGDQRGRSLGFPTANLPVPPGVARPADGVYAGWLTRPDEPGAPLPAAISVGTNPTFDGHEVRVEAHVLDRDDLELYGVEVAVDFTARLRGMVRFDGVGALVAQLRDDVAGTRRALGLASAV